MKSKKTLLITTGICLLPMLFAAFIYQELPEQIATHWSFDETPNGYSSKAFACFPVISLIVCTTTLVYALGYKISISRIVPALIGILFIILGNYLPKCKQNYTVGIKLPWTLNSEENWNRTHHLSGYLFILAGVIMLMTAFIPQAEFLMLVTIIIAVFVPMVYSFILYKKGI